MSPHEVKKTAALCPFHKAVPHPKLPGSGTKTHYRGTPSLKHVPVPRAYAHPKLPGSAPAVQFGPSQKAVTGLKATIGGRQEKAALACPVQACRSPKSRGATRRRTIGKTWTKNSGADRRSVLIAAPQRAGERLGDDLCDAFIQNAEGKGLGWPLFGRPVLP